MEQIFVHASEGTQSSLPREAAQLGLTQAQYECAVIQKGREVLLNMAQSQGGIELKLSQADVDELNRTAQAQHIGLVDLVAKLAHNEAERLRGERMTSLGIRIGGT